MREILPELERGCESHNRKARKWGRVTGKPETILSAHGGCNEPIRLKRRDSFQSEIAGDNPLFATLIRRFTTHPISFAVSGLGS
jgi:hypothetical protein